MRRQLFQIPRRGSDHLRSIQIFPPPFRASLRVALSHRHGSRSSTITVHTAPHDHAAAAVLHPMRFKLRSIRHQTFESFGAAGRVEPFEFGRPTAPPRRPSATLPFPFPTMSRSIPLLLLLLVVVGIAATHAQGEQTEGTVGHSLWHPNSEQRAASTARAQQRLRSALTGHRCVLCWPMFVRACSDSCRCDCCIVRRPEQTAMQGHGAAAAQRGDASH